MPAGAQARVSRREWCRRRSSGRSPMGGRGCRTRGRAAAQSLPAGPRSAYPPAPAAQRRSPSGSAAISGFSSARLPLDRAQPGIEVVDGLLRRQRRRRAAIVASAVPRRGGGGEIRGADRMEARLRVGLVLLYGGGGADNGRFAAGFLIEDCETAEPRRLRARLRRRRRGRSGGGSGGTRGNALVEPPQQP